MAIDGAAWRAAVDSQLRPSESLRFIASARTKPGDTGGGLTLMPLGTLYRWAHRYFENASAKRASSNHSFPLRRRMIWAVTDRRIIVWELARRPRGEPVGAYDRSAILHADRPDVGGLWRTVVLTLSDGEELVVQLGGDSADNLAKDLNAA
ncbi:MAG TPA: hypothetical protein VHC43_09440 [Mycobacteriales bacterium]|nr:hypothetical protein [Mycobacteriales bacterium]